jgi:hypothetical protein
VPEPAAGRVADGSQQSGFGIQEAERMADGRWRVAVVNNFSPFFGRLDCICPCGWARLGVL